ncbi:MAG: methyltransferase domain-containing protein [Gemmataceae bacterium]|nr:RNA methyltransferase [Gemmata sp.]MDW8198090.1 methyltransferase domain-containing protein [Gemmataceae bacterium]
MSRSGRPTADKPLPPLYAMTHGGLEAIAADEITRDLGGDVKKTARGLVVFRVAELTEQILSLRTTEDVFLLAWGSDSLTYTAEDLDTIRHWTARKPDWPHLFKLHHKIRPKTKGKPTYHIVCQMQGEHGYRRADAREAFIDGLAGQIPRGWHYSNENAWLELWLTIHSNTAVCGVRLSDRTMRHRTYKLDHVAASLRPTVAAAMVRLAGIGPGMTVLDPFCGAGTILAETLVVARQRRAGGAVRVLGGDIDPNAVFVTAQNLVHVGPADLARWDATALPLERASVDRIITNPPFGKQLSSPDAIEPLYTAAAAEWDRVLKPGGRAVLLVMEQDILKRVLQARRWSATRQMRVRLLGQPCVVSVWNKPPERS